jgi:hypothetical protein
MTKVEYWHYIVAGKGRITYFTQVTFWMTFIAAKNHGLEFWG